MHDSARPSWWDQLEISIAPISLCFAGPLWTFKGFFRSSPDSSDSNFYEDQVLKSIYNKPLLCQGETKVVIRWLLPLKNFFFFLFQTLDFLFCIWVQAINNVVVISGEQQRDSAMHMRVSILPQAPLPSRLPRNTEQRSMCYPVGPYWFSILNIAENF